MTDSVVCIILWHLYHVKRIEEVWPNILSYVKDIIVQVSNLLV